MRIFLEGEDVRAAHLGEMLKARGHCLKAEGPWELVILSMPRTRMRCNMLEALPKGQRIVAGMLPEEANDLAREKEWRLFRPLADETYTSMNAILSAEGAVFYAMEQADFSLSGARCMILGYGRIGKALQKMLLGLGAKVTVAARREESRLAAGRDSIPFCDLTSRLHEMQVIFNTVPARVLEKEQLSCIPKDALLMELASPPYGMDLAAAGEMGLHAWGEWGIPGRYCPKSAANLLFDYMDREALI